MKIYIDRFSAQMQIICTEDFTPYETISVILGRGSYLDNAVTLYSGVPLSNILFPFTFSTNQLADVYLIGNKASGEQIELSTQPIRGNVDVYDIVLKQELAKVIEQRRRRLMMGEEVTIYLRQLAEKCSCWDLSYNQADPNCSVCGGTGLLQSYIGVNQRIVIPVSESLEYEKNETGIAITRKYSQCFSAPFPYLSDKDIIERRNGERYYIQKTMDERLADQLIGQKFDLVSVQDYAADRFDINKI